MQKSLTFKLEQLLIYIAGGHDNSFYLSVELPATGTVQQAHSRKLYAIAQLLC